MAYTADDYEYDDDHDDDGYVIRLDEHGPAVLEGRRFRRISQREARLISEGKRFPNPNSLGLTTVTNMEHPMVMKNRSVRKPFMNKFYVGSSDMATKYFRNANPTNTFPTVDEAIEAAKLKVESGQSECEIVVQVVRIIKRAPRPVRVEKV